MTAKDITLILATLACLLPLSGCEKPVNVNDLPVSYWADPKSIKEDSFGHADACSLASAQAIVKAGLPFPNYGTKDEVAADGKTINKRINTVDVWLGGVRFVFPAELVSSGGYPAHNPNRFNGLHGTLPHFYPKGPYAPVKDGMGAMVEVAFGCIMDLKDPRFINFKRPRSNDEAIQQAKAEYETDIASNKALPGTVTVSERKDLGMIEILMNKGAEALVSEVPK